MAGSLSLQLCMCTHKYLNDNEYLNKYFICILIYMFNVAMYSVPLKMIKTELYLKIQSARLKIQNTILEIQNEDFFISAEPVCARQHKRVSLQIQDLSGR